MMHGVCDFQNSIKEIMADKTPKVSVCVVTYNQEKFIGQCLQSIVDQVVNFDIEVIVADDCSTDGTRDIIKDFFNKYPKLIKPVLRDKNIGPGENYIDVHQRACGQYISHVEADDYFLPNKLQLQADYLDENSKCNFVWHRMQVMNDATGIIVDDLIDVSQFPQHGFDRGDILQLMAIGMNSSKMYRSAVRDFDLPSFPVMDFFANVEQVGQGVANFVGDTPLGVYRAGIGVASAGNKTKIILQKSFLYFTEKYPEYKKDICSAVILILASAIKNRRWSIFSLYLPLLLKTFSIGVFFKIWKWRKIIPMLKIPAAVRSV
jgi:glycosyltransferase involved in cell wall biosynthesis